MLSQSAIWNRIKSICSKREEIESLAQRKRHKIIAVSEVGVEKQYTIRYESGNTIGVKLTDVYNVYKELYRRKRLESTYMEENYERILPDWPRWHAPGRAILAILPKLDENIEVEYRGRSYTLKVKDE